MFGLRILIVLGLVAPAAAQDWAKAFREDAPQHWAEYRESAKRWSKKSDGGLITSAGAEKERSQSETIAWDGSFVMKSESFGKEPRRSARGHNSTYSFEVEQKDSPSWTLIGLTSDPNAQEGIFKDDPVRVERSLCMAICVDRHLLPDLVASEDFHLESVEPVGDDGLVTIHFRYEPKERGPNDVMQGGQFTLDSRRDWTVVQFHLDMRTAVKRPDGSEKTEIWVRDVTIEYDPNSKPPWPIKHKEDRRVISSDFENVGTWKMWANVQFSETKDDPTQFTLAAFGLSEPGVAEPPRTKTPPWVLAAVAASVLLIVGVIMYRRGF